MRRLLDDDTDAAAPEAHHFRIDWRVPIAVLVPLGTATIIGIAGGSWWMSNLSDRLFHVESAVQGLQAANAQTQQVASSLDARLAAIEAQLKILVNLMQQERADGRR